MIPPAFSGVPAWLWKRLTGPDEFRSIPMDVYHKILARAYEKAGGKESADVDPRLEAIVERMLDKYV